MVMCEECGLKLTAASMASHLQTHNGWSVRAMTLLMPLPFPIPKKQVTFPWTNTSIYCPVGGVTGRADSCPNLRQHFINQHMEDKIIILNKCTGPHPCCDQFYIVLPRSTFLAGNISTKMFRRGAYLNIHFLADNASWVDAGTEFQYHEHILEKVDILKYLGRMISFDESYLPVIFRNLHRDHSK